MSFLDKFINHPKKMDDIATIKNENFKVSQQMVSMGSWTRNLLNNEVYFSDEIYCVLECSRDSFDGNLEKYYLLVHPADVDNYKKIKQRELNGFEYEVEYRINTPSGVTKYIHEKTKAIYDENKKNL